MSDSPQQLIEHCGNINSSVHSLHLILYGLENEFTELIQNNPQYNTFRDKSQNNTLILLNYRLTHNKGYTDYYDADENIYYLYYPSNIVDSYGAGHNYLVEKAFEFELKFKKCKHHYFARMDPDIRWEVTPNSFTAGVTTFEEKYNRYFKQMLSTFEPAEVGAGMSGNTGEYDTERCIDQYQICGIAHHDFCFMTMHHELMENRLSPLITELDHLSWWSNAFLSWNINSWSFKNHVFNYRGFRTINTEHKEYPRQKYIPYAIQYLQYHVLKNDSKLIQCYPQRIINGLKSGRTRFKDYELNDCGKHKCISSYEQCMIFGYPQVKGNKDYSVSIDFKTVSQQYVDDLCPLV